MWLISSLCSTTNSTPPNLPSKYSNVTQLHQMNSKDLGARRSETTESLRNSEKRNYAKKTQKNCTFAAKISLQPFQPLLGFMCV